MYGLLYCPLLFNEINDKDDGIIYNTTQRPWLVNVPPHYQLKNDKGVLCTTTDISIYYYIKWKYPDVDFRLINPHDKSTRYKQNRLNFYFVYNKGEAFSFDTRTNYARACVMLDNDNVYPPPSWQHLVDHKQNMYEYLKDNNVNILPYVYISNLHESPLKSLTDFLTTHKIQKFIVRPEYGTTSKDILIRTDNDIHDKAFQTELHQLIHQYPGILVNQYIDGIQRFGEFKVYFVGDNPFCVYHLFQDVVTFEGTRELMYNVNHPKVKDVVAYARNIFLKLPPFNMYGVAYPRIITRIDVACCLQNILQFEPSRFFVTEVESVPSISLPGMLFDAIIAEQLHNVMTFDQHHMQKQQQNQCSYYAIVLYCIAILLIALTIVVLRCYSLIS